MGIDTYSPSINPERSAGYPVVFDPVTNLTFELQIDRNTHPDTSTYGVLWVSVSTWRLAKNLWSSWAVVRDEQLSWGLAKSKVY